MSRQAVPHNPSNEPSGKDYLGFNVKIWVVLPMLLFHGLGAVVLICLVFHFVYSPDPDPDYLWPALVTAFAGLPFSFATSIKKLVDAVTTDTA